MAPTMNSTPSPYPAHSDSDSPRPSRTNNPPIRLCGPSQPYSSCASQAKTPTVATNGKAASRPARKVRAKWRTGRRMGEGAFMCRWAGGDRGRADYGGVAGFARQLRHTPGSIQIRALERPKDMNKINRDARRQAGRASAWALALMCCLQPGAQAAPPTSTAPSDCGCQSLYDETHEAATPLQQALFAAAHQADADAFLRLLPVSGDISDVTMAGEPLVSAIIRPAPQLKTTDENWGWTRSPERERLFDAHRATHAARQRMLNAALAQGARPNLITYQHRIPALQLAIAFGSPDMVDALLLHGADPRQANQDRSLTPLEFLLDHEFFLRMRGLPELLTRQAATSQELLDTGHDALPTAAAAYLGDEQALTTLLQHLPKQQPAAYEPDKNPPFDLHLDAALAALQGGHTALAKRLLRPDMPWDQS